MKESKNSSIAYWQQLLLPVGNEANQIIKDLIGQMAVQEIEFLNDKVERAGVYPIKNDTNEISNQ